MKIGIVGNYGNNNNGDEAILLGIIEQVKSVYGVVEHDIVVFTNNPFQTTERYGVVSYPLYYKGSHSAQTFFHTLKMNRPVIRTLDLLIVGGGGILMDYYKTEPFLFGLYGKMAKWSRVPYVVYGCGAGPIHTKVGRTLLKDLVKHAENVSVRDPKSEQLLKKIGVKRDIALIGDPAFALKPETLKTKNDQIEHVGMTVVPYFDGAYWPTADEEHYERYTSAMAKSIDTLMEKFPNMRLTLFSTKYPHDVDVTKKVYAKLEQRDRVVVNEAHLSPKELLAFIDTQDVIIGTRLHSLYLSVSTKTPIIAIAYHHKVEHFAQMTGLDSLCLEIESVIAHPEQLVEKMDQLQSDWGGALQKIEEVNATLVEMSERGEQLLGLS